MSHKSSRTRRESSIISAVQKQLAAANALEGFFWGGSQVCLLVSPPFSLCFSSKYVPLGKTENTVAVARYLKTHFQVKETGWEACVVFVLFSILVDDAWVRDIGFDNFGTPHQEEEVVLHLGAAVSFRLSRAGVIIKTH